MVGQQQVAPPPVNGPKGRSGQHDNSRSACGRQAGGGVVRWPQLGSGVGLRSEHYDEVLTDRPAIAWFEAISENYMDTGGRPVHVLERVRRDYPVVLHGVGLSIGSTDPLNPTYLQRLKALVDRIEPSLVSDHLCWTGSSAHDVHDLLPLPFTEEAVRHVAERIQRVQDVLGRRMLIENVSSYISYRHSSMTEWEFIAAIATRADCGVLLDVNNVYVNAHNHGFDPADFVNGIPRERVGQIHVAGHTDRGAYLFDTHDGPVIDPVWQLYSAALERFGPVSTLMEWDAKIPPLQDLMAEAQHAQHIMEQTCDVLVG